MPRPLAPWEVALDLAAAAKVAISQMPARSRRERAKLETATTLAIQIIMTGTATAGPPREAALAHFRQSMRAALAAGVGRDELVIAFNGDSDK